MVDLDGVCIDPPWKCHISKFGGAPSGTGPAGGGGLGPGGGHGGPPGGAGVPPSEGVLTGSADTGIWDFIDYGGLLGDRGLLYELRLVGDYLEITTDAGIVISGSQSFLDWFESETGIGGLDTTLPEDGEDELGLDDPYYGSGDHPNVREIDPVDNDPPEEDEILQKKPLEHAKETVEKLQEVIIDVLEPVEELKSEGEIYLGKLARRIPFIGPGWDRLRETLREKLTPVRDELKEILDRGDPLPGVVKETLEDAIDFTTSVITLEAVPLPIPYPGDALPPQLRWLPLVGWILQVLWWLSRREQSPSLPTQRPYRDPDDQDDDFDEGEQDGDFIEPRPQPILFPVPQEVGDDGVPSVTYNNGCFFHKVRPRVWLRVCRRRGYWELKVKIDDYTIVREM